MNDDDDDIQDAYCKLYKFHVRFVKDKFIAKLDETNKLNENLNFQFSSHVDKIKSLEEQLVESKTKVEKLTSAKLVVEPKSKEKYFYIAPFKRNNEELKTNIARIDKGKNSNVDAEVSTSMSKTPPIIKVKSEFVLTYHHCHIVGHIKPNCPKLRSLSTSKVKPPTRKFSSSKITHVCHLCCFQSHSP